MRSAINALKSALCGMLLAIAVVVPMRTMSTPVAAETRTDAIVLAYLGDAEEGDEIDLAGIGTEIEVIPLSDAPRAAMANAITIVTPDGATYEGVPVEDFGSQRIDTESATIYVDGETVAIYTDEDIITFEQTDCILCEK